MSIQIGRIYDPPTRRDGRRVLVDRLWPRGMSKDRASLDEWCREVAPSTELRKWYGHDPERFTEFRERYLAELTNGTQAASLAHLRDLAAKQRVLLLTAAKDHEHSEATVLADILRSAISRR